MYVVTVHFKIHPVHWDVFMAAMHRNAKNSLESELGCRQFDVCQGEPGECAVFLYEVYDTQADFTAHLGSSHFLQFNTETAAWVADKKVRTFSRITPVAVT